MKNVLITGGSRGIGAACVKAFAENGWRVFFTYRSSEAEAHVLAAQTGAIAVKCDVSKAEDLEKIENEIEKFGGRFNAIVNNAGIAQQKMFADITEEEWDTMFNINVKGMYLTTKRFIPKMISAHEGSIINISSVWGMGGGSCEVHYSASKAAVIGFTKSLACEMGPSGIRVNCVAPGVIDTKMNSHLGEEDIKALEEETPLCRTGKPEEVAETVLFLADKGSFITGEVIKVSGGF